MGKKNIFGNELMYFQPSDELSAIVAVEAMACQGGRYADNTSSQGLLLKTKNLFSVAGKRLPVVMTVMAREVNKGSLSIHCGHTDFYAVRNAGWAQLVTGDNQELHDLLPMAYKVSEMRQVMLPCMVIGDGFIKSHAIENIKELSDDYSALFCGGPQPVLSAELFLSDSDRHLHGHRPDHGRADQPGFRLPLYAQGLYCRV